MTENYPFDGFLVTEDMHNIHPKILGYFLMAGDLLVQDTPTTWSKVCPGLGILGLTLTSTQVETLKPVKYNADGLEFSYILA